MPISRLLPLPDAADRSLVDPFRRYHPCYDITLPSSPSLAAPSTLLSRRGSRARGSTGRCRDRRERERKRERRECADTRFVTERNRKRRILRCRWHPLSGMNASEFPVLCGDIRKSRGGIREIRQFGQQTTIESLNFETTRISHAIDLLRLSATRFKGAVAPHRVTLAVSDRTLGVRLPRSWRRWSYAV